MKYKSRIGEKQVVIDMPESNGNYKEMPEPRLIRLTKLIEAHPAALYLNEYALIPVYTVSFRVDETMYTDQELIDFVDDCIARSVRKDSVNVD